MKIRKSLHVTYLNQIIETPKPQNPKTPKPLLVEFEDIPYNFMKILILVLAATMCSAQWTTLATGILSGAACAVGYVSGCITAASDAYSFYSQETSSRLTQTSCLQGVANTVSSIGTTYNDGLSWSGVSDLVNTLSTGYSAFTNCVSSSKLSGFPAELKTHFKKIANDVANVAPKLNQMVTIKTHEMGVK